MPPKPLRVFRLPLPTEGPVKANITPALLDEKQAAIYLAVSVGALRDWTRAGRVPFCKLNRLKRYRKVDLDALIARSMSGESQVPP